MAFGPERKRSESPQTTNGYPQTARSRIHGIPRQFRTKSMRLWPIWWTSPPFTFKQAVDCRFGCLCTRTGKVADGCPAEPISNICQH